MFRAIAVPLLALFLSSGCVIAKPARHTHHGSSKSALKSRSKPECHPSQYWDGEQCRHKGKGKGARKHDGRHK